MNEKKLLLKDAAKYLNINYSTAKTILRIWRIEKRIHKKSYINNKKKKNFRIMKTTPENLNLLISNKYFTINSIKSSEFLKKCSNYNFTLFSRNPKSECGSSHDNSTVNSNSQETCNINQLFIIFQALNLKKKMYDIIVANNDNTIKKLHCITEVITLIINNNINLMNNPVIKQIYNNLSSNFNLNQIIENICHY